MMSVYAICTGSRRNEPFVPVIFRFENFRRRNGSHKIPLFQRVLWWARQGLNLRPHPCEGHYHPLPRLFVVTAVPGNPPFSKHKRFSHF